MDSRKYHLSDTEVLEITFVESTHLPHYTILMQSSIFSKVCIQIKQEHLIDMNIHIDVYDGNVGPYTFKVVFIVVHSSGIYFLLQTPELLPSFPKGELF